MAYGTSGSFNVALGFHTLANNTGENNVCAGYYSMTSNTQANDNVAIGYTALYSNTTACENAAVGSGALHNQAYNNNNNTFLSRNTAVGFEALFTNNPTSSANGIRNTAVGHYALYSNTIGYENTASGSSSLFANTTGMRNSAFGLAALNDLTAGDYNAAFGYNSGPSSTYPELDNTTALGNGAAVTANNQVRVGNSSVTSIGGQVNWTALSDGRFKKDIREDIPGLDFIMKIRPVSFHYDISSYNKFLGVNEDDQWKGKNDIQQMRFSGFVAQEVETAARQCNYEFSGIDTSGDAMGLRYAEFVIPMIKAIQEQQKLIEKLQQRITELEKK